ncbi:hypothetical protein C8F04DRAFT_1318562 [Mycena alexandri]|uniref:Uncharacterized protein n=1 Tax=Mycena alexandri TaxID=1745969 RepID=A0AAD6S3Q9_9AGAR|nr:hypothetical protein C8F04DRAFT_1318562 [Mycena alexandri]
MRRCLQIHGDTSRSPHSSKATHNIDQAPPHVLPAFPALYPANSEALRACLPYTTHVALVVLKPSQQRRQRGHRPINPPTPAPPATSWPPAPLPTACHSRGPPPRTFQIRPPTFFAATASPTRPFTPLPLLSLQHCPRLVPSAPTLPAVVTPTSRRFLFLQVFLLLSPSGCLRE